MKHYVKLIKEDKRRHEQDIINTLEQKMDEQRTDMSKQMDICYNKLLGVVQDAEDRSFAEDKIIHEEIDVIKSGMLSLEGKTFKEECRRLLDIHHVITLSEYELIQTEHDVYNKLGGNHEGDGLFSMVVAKYQNALNNKEEVD